MKSPNRRARIYLGVHFSFDMIGATLVAALTWLALRERRLYLPLTYNLTSRLHGVLFSKLIALGWVRK